MFLGILGAIALAVGTVQTSHDLAEARGLPLEEGNPAIVRVIEPTEDLGYPDPDMGL